MVDQCLDIGVVEQVGEFVIEVAIVDVDRDAPIFMAAKFVSLVLGRVVQVHPDLRVRTQPGVEERLRQPSSPPLVVTPT
ncbi:MAG: hypothetical protein R2710_08550 [Acidimicrobiales bacterium]